MTLGINCPLREVAQRSPSAIALIDAGSNQRWTFDELSRSTQRVALELAARGVSAGQRVAWIDQADWRSVFLLWGVLRLGAVAVPLSPRWPSELLRKTQAAVALDWLLSAEQQNEFFSAASRTSGSDVAAASIELDLLDQRPRTLLFSSGSSGTPKAIAHALPAHLASAQAANANLVLQAGDRWLLSLPLYHAAGLGIVFRCLLARATVVVPPAVLLLHQLLDPWQVTHLSLVPVQLKRLLDQRRRPPTCLQAILLGGAPLPGDLVSSAFTDGWSLCTSYGLTETASQVTAAPHPATREDLQTSGYVLAGRELRIEPCGEIAVRGNTLSCGYVQGATLLGLMRDDGWFPTGDLGSQDDCGRLVVRGRRDHMFISGGENIYPEEIERQLLALPGIRQSIVVPVDDPDFGQRPVAFVEAEPWAMESWRDALRDHLPGFKIPTRFLPWPAQDGLKPNRRWLRELAQQAIRNAS